MSAGRDEDLATAVSRPCCGYRADHQARAGSKRPKVENPSGQIQQCQQEENENRDIALGQLE